MINPLLVFAAGTLLGGLAAPPPSGESPAFAIEREVHRMAAAGAGERKLWPGFDPLAIPLAVYDGEKTYLFRHPAPPAEFSPLAAAAPPGVFAMAGRHEAVTANTNSEIAGVATATLILDPAQSDRGPADLAAIAIHEAFHVDQRARHPSWMGNEADLFAYPDDSPELLALRRLETSALRRALAAGDASATACWARGALELRKRRYARMDEAFAAYERGTELNEGLATYVQMRAADRQTVDLPPEGFGPDEVRRRAYLTGSALGLLLDRFMSGWAAAFEAQDKQTLDEALAAALGEGTVCRLEEAVVAEADRKAGTDVAKLARQRQARLNRFLEAPGWRVVVEAGDGEPLWPQGFDPLNVEVVGDGRVLHTRFLRLGNSSGQLEALDARALTDAAGRHPLFEGVRRVELTGLAEPALDQSDGAVRLSASGLALEFKGASVARSEKALTVRLGGSGGRTLPTPTKMRTVPGSRVRPISATTSEAELRSSMSKLDVHAHYRHSRSFLPALLKRWNMRAVLVDVALPDAEQRQARWEAIRRQRARSPELFEICSSFEPSRIDDPDFARSVVARLREEIGQGAVMVKVWKDTGMVVRDGDGRFVQVDDPRLQPIWDYLTEAGIPVLAHIGEPLQAWRPLEKGNPHEEYYRRNPQYHAYLHPEIPRWETIMEARDRWLERNPRLTVIGAHLGSMAHDVDEVAKRLLSYPNFHVETAARFGDLTRQDSKKVREFFVRFQDRILYGTDLSTRRPEGDMTAEEIAAERERFDQTHEQHWQYLSGSGTLRFDRPGRDFSIETQGLALPLPVLKKFYYENAARLLGL